MKYGIHFGHFGADYNRLGAEECLRQAKSIGAEVFEFFPTPEMFKLNNDAVQRLRCVVEELEMEPVFTFGYPSGWDMASDDDKMREKAVSHIKLAIEGMHMLGAKTIGGIVYSNWPAMYDNRIIEPEEKERCLERVAQSLTTVMPTAEKYEVTVCLEIVNRFEHYLMNTAKEGVAMCKMVNSPSCKLLLDCFHMNIEEDDLSEAILSAKGYIGHFHVSEPNRKVPFHSERQNWSKIGKALRETGYTGNVVIEPFYVFGGEQGHNMRMWRNLDDDTSFKRRLELACEGIKFIRGQFEKEGI